MQETPNYNLKKIELEDSPPDITVINPNWDKIDQEIAVVQNAASAAQQTAEDAQEAVDNLTPAQIGAATQAEVSSILNSGFVGTLKALPAFTNYNNLTTPGIYHGVYNGAKTNEPVTTGGNRRVTIEIMSYGGHTIQHLEYNDGAGAGRKYFRFLDGVHRPWVEIWTRVSNPSYTSFGGGGNPRYAYQVLASGQIIQWGGMDFTHEGNWESGLNITFPIAFPNRVFSFVVTKTAFSVSETKDFTPGYRNLTNTGVTIQGDSGYDHGFSWIALGY